MARTVGRFLPVMLAASAVMGCGARSAAPSTPMAPASTSAPAPTTASSPTTSATTTATPSGPTAPTQEAPASRSCSVSDVHISVTAPLGSAGALHYQLVFTNDSPSTCALYGFPGVSFLDARGHQIGPPAAEGTAGDRRRVTLAPGGRAYARLDVADPTVGPCAGPGQVALIRVYPPASTADVLVAPPSEMQVCTSADTSTFTGATVGPVAATSSPGYNP